MANRFYTSFPLSAGPVVLQGAEAHHLASVRRFRAGDAVVLFNGDGNEYPAEILATGHKSVSLNVLRVETAVRELPFRLRLAAPSPRGERLDMLIEKLTELGVTEFIPIRTERSVVHPRPAKLERLQRIVIEASKLCGRNTLMQVSPPANWDEFCRGRDPKSLNLLAHPGSAGKLAAFQSIDVCAAVGPEGGFTDEEVSLALGLGWQVLDLGPRVLRVETAGIALAALLALRF
jgi:16S rRNA (uracil1498-N3)-methyltransferase